jgi:alanine-synthesizing transaminase
MGLLQISDITESDQRYEGLQQDHRIRAHVAELKKAGKKIIFFGSSDPVSAGFVNPLLKKALSEAADKGLAMYPQLTTLQQELREAICIFEKKHNGVHCTPDDCILTPGIAGAIQVVHYSLFDCGKEVLILEPCHYYDPPTTYFGLFGTKVSGSRCLEGENWQPDLDELRKKINKNTIAISMDHPVNPTGAVYEEKKLRQIIDLAGEYNIPLIADEMYRLITFESREVKSIARLASDVPVIIVNGMSKLFMCPGWRVGYICIHDPGNKISKLTKNMKTWSNYYGHATNAIPTPILYAANKIFQGPFDESMKMVKETEKRKNYTMKKLSEIQGVSCVEPKATLYAFPRIDAIGKVWKTEDKFMIHLLDEQGVAFFPGLKFGSSGFGHIRTLVQRSEQEQDEAYSKLDAFLKKHT